MKPYVLRAPNVPAVTPVLVVLAFAFVPKLLGMDGFPPVFLAVFFAFALVNAWRATVVLRVDDAGVRTPRAEVPWSSIQALVLTETELTVHMTSGEPELRVEVPRGVDRAALTAAVDGRVPLRN